MGGDRRGREGERSATARLIPMGRVEKILEHKKLSAAGAALIRACLSEEFFTFLVQ